MYALGVVSYQLMSGHLPYEAASLTDLARLQESGPPPRLSDEVRDVPPTLAAAVSRALARDPARRYEDAAEMEDALRDGLAGVGHTEDLDATRHLPDDDATRMLAAHEHRHARAPPAAAGGRGPAPAAPPRAVAPPAGAAAREVRRGQVGRAGLASCC